MELVIYFLFTFVFIASTNSSVSAQKTAAKTFNAPETAIGQSEAIAPIDQESAPVALIEAGTPVFLVTHNEMNTKYIKTGMTVCLYLKFPLKIAGFNIIPVGTPAYCKITQADMQGNGRSGYIEVEPLYILFKPDEVLALTGNPVFRHGRDRENLPMGLAQLGHASAGLLQQAQGIADVQQAKRDAALQVPSFELAQRQAYDLGYGAIEPVAPVNPVIKGPGALSHVAQALNIVAPMAGLFIKGKHAVILEGYILNAFVAGDTWVEVNEE